MGRLSGIRDRNLAGEVRVTKSFFLIDSAGTGTFVILF